VALVKTKAAVKAPHSIDRTAAVVCKRWSFGRFVAFVMRKVAYASSSSRTLLASTSGLKGFCRISATGK
jgi:hypothetical protein